MALTPIEISETAGILELRLPVVRNWLMMLLLLCWLPLWAFGLVATVQALLTTAVGGVVGGVMLLLWLVGWLCGGLFALFAVCWMLWGREVIRIDDSTLTLVRKLYGLGRCESYRLEHIRALRLVPDQPGLYELATSLRVFGFGGGKIAFDYLSLPCQFGAGIDVVTAEEVLLRLKTRLSSS